MCYSKRESMEPLMSPKLYASSGKDISKCIESGSMKLATQVDYVYMERLSQEFPCNQCIFV